MAVNTKTRPLRLEQMWEQATEDFYKLTAKDLKKKSTQPATFESVMQQIENTPIEDDMKKSARDTKNKLKDATLDATKCIKLLGGIAAQAASATFPASGLCFNAVSFLLDAPFKIISLYAQLTELFQTVATFLKQFKIFERIEKSSDIDPALLETVNQLLICFVRICALSIKLLHGGTWEQVKVYLKKSLLDKDPGVSDELAKLKRLSQARDSITQSLTLEAALKSDNKLTDLLLRASETDQKIEDIAKGIRNVTVGMDFLVDAERDKVRQKQLDDIKTNLGIEKLLNESDKQYRDAETRQVKGTGSWLLEQDQFQQWIEPAAKGTQFLLLLGKKNVGKSFLIPAVSEHIRAQKRDATEQIALAKYFFPQDTDRSGTKSPQIQQAFKCLAYQLAQENKVYAKELAVICKAELNQLSGKELWEKLKFEEATHGTTFILILDGIDQLHSANEELFNVLANLQVPNDASSSGLRILLSGPRSSMGHLVEREPAIEVTEHNSEDVKKYIEKSLEEADVLRGDEGEVVNLRKLVTEKLPGEAGNDFYKMDIAVREISRQRYLDEAGVHRVLDKAGAEIKEIIKRDLQQLNETLDPPSIKELNELLSWIFCFAGVLRINELKAAHALGHDKTAVRPLKKILKDDYGSIFEIDDDEYVTVSSPEIQECLIFEKRHDSGSRMENEEGAQRTVTITKEEINILRNFIKAFVDPETFEKFGFEAFFQGKRDAQVRIGINIKDAYTTVISTLLDLFQNNKKEKMSELGRTALSELPFLLDPNRGIGELSELDSEHKSKIGSGLIGFLSGRVDFWVGKYGHGTPSSWLEDDDALDTLWRWLKDSTVVKASGQGETDWIDRVTDPNAKYQLLRPVVLAYAHHWLRDTSWNTWDDASVNCHLRNPVYWIQNYLARERFSKKEIDKFEVTYRLTEDQIAASANWAGKELSIEQQDSLWYERLGRTYLLFGKRDGAMETFIEARKRGLTTTTITEQLAKSYAGLGKYAEATDCMKDVVKDLKSVENPSEKDADRLRGDVHVLIEWYSKIREPDMAMKWCEEALKYDKEKYRVYRMKIKTLFENDRIKEAAELLLEWSHQSATDYDLSMLEAMQYDFAVYCVAEYDYDDENDHFHAIMSLAQQIEKYDTVLEAMAKAVDFAKSKKEDDALGVLLLYRGNAFDKSHLGKDGSSSALRDWHDCRVVGKRSGGIVGFQATRNIGFYHFKEAMNPQCTGDEQQEHVQRLEKILRESKSDPNIWISDDAAGYLEALLAIYYRSVGDDAKARQLLQREIKNYLDMLSDEWPENDWQAYQQLAVILARYGDDCNALSAWSLLPPSDAGSESPSPKRQGDLRLYCDGRCSTRWTYANDIWYCRYCANVKFDSVCLEKLRAGTLLRDICSPNHQFLRVPKWSDEEFRAVGKDRVRVGGEIQPDGTRNGGEIMTVEEWKNRLYEEWDIQKPAKREKEEEKDKEAGEEVKEKDGEVSEEVSGEVTSLSTEQPTVVETSAS